MVEGGQIVEQWTPAEPLATDGAYVRLYEVQFGAAAAESRDPTSRFSFRVVGIVDEKEYVVERKPRITKS